VSLGLGFRRPHEDSRFCFPDHFSLAKVRMSSRPVKNCTGWYDPGDHSISRGSVSEIFLFPYPFRFPSDARFCFSRQPVALMRNCTSPFFVVVPRLSVSAVHWADARMPLLPLAVHGCLFSTESCLLAINLPASLPVSRPFSLPVKFTGPLPDLKLDKAQSV